ncbi:TolC family protein [Neolewinella maritima]|uniref:TolC family protein n=1 Tax=Neolewinella maritima TaxID=1383882 RepID=UPI001EE8E162|nr:TolC family protein [Neolewinella maritima]
MSLAALLLAVTWGGAAGAQSLDSLRSLLRQDNPELIALSYDYRAALAVSPQLRQLPDLEIRGGVSILPVETRLGPQRARVMVTQMLPWPGTLVAMSALADARAQPLLEQAAALQLELLYRLETTYYTIVAAEEQAAALRESLDLYASLREVALTRVENSRGSSVDAYRAELQTNLLQRRIEALRAEAAAAWTTIEELVNQPLPRTLVVPQVALPRELPDELSLQDHPQIRVFALQEEISRRAVVLSDLEARPSFGVGVDYILTGPRTDAEPEGNGRDAILPRVMLRLPLSGGKYQSKRDEEALRIQAIATRRTSVTNQLTATIRRAEIARLDAERRLSFLRQQVNTAAAALTIARSEYANGRRPFDELLRLENELIDYRLEAITTQQTLLNQAALVDRYLPRR